MLGLAGVPLIKKALDATFNVSLASAGLVTYQVTIEEVDPARTLLEIISANGGYWNTNVYYSYDAGLYLYSPTTLKLDVNCLELANGPFSIAIKARVYELNSKPRSLQGVQGNGSTSQSLSRVDPAKAMLMRGWINARDGQFNNSPTIGGTSLTWTQAWPTYCHAQVVEF